MRFPISDGGERQLRWTQSKTCEYPSKVVIGAIKADICSDPNGRQAEAKEDSVVERQRLEAKIKRLQDELKIKRLQDELTEAREKIEWLERTTRDLRASSTNYRLLWITESRRAQLLERNDTSCVSQAGWMSSSPDCSYGMV